MLADYYQAVFEYGFNSRCKMTIPENLSGKTVLDLGCRRGKGVFKLSQSVGETGHVIGIDWCADYIREAEKNASAALLKSGFETNNMEFHVGYPEDLKSCGIADSSIDVVWLNSVHNLFFDQSRAFAECARVLKPNGLMVCETVYADSPRDSAVLAEARKIGNVVQSAQSKNNYESLLQEAGFSSPEYVEQCSVEPFMGYRDDCEVDVAPSEEDVRFINAVAFVRKLS